MQYSVWSRCKVKGVAEADYDEILIRKFEKVTIKMEILSQKIRRKNVRCDTCTAI